MKVKKKNKEIESDENNDKKGKEENEENEKDKDKKMKEKAKSLVDEKNMEKLLKGVCKFGVEYGIKEGTKSVIVPKLINVISDWFKSILKNKLLPKFMARFDEFFLVFGERVIELQIKYNIKDYMDKILYSLEISFHCITTIKTFIIPPLKETINKLKKDGKKVDTHIIISEFSDKLIKLGEEKALNPIKEFINKIFGSKNTMQKYQFFEKIIEEGYKKVRKVAIDKYNNIKSNVNEKYEEYKKMYQDKKDKIINLPDNLLKQYNEKKKEYVKIYEEKKKNIIETTDKIINDLKKKNLVSEFEKIMRKIRDLIIQKLKAIENKAKDCIAKISSIIPNFFGNLLNLINNVLKLDFGPFDENKINISELLLNFLIEIETGNIKLKKKNENNEETYEDGKKLLIDYINCKLNIDKKCIKEIIEYLLKNGLKSILIRQINIVMKYGQKQFEEIKKYYEPILNFVKEKLLALKEDISKTMQEYKDKINDKIDSVFDYIIKFLINRFKNVKVLDYYLKKITFIENFQNELLDCVQTLKNDAISNLSTKFEEEIKNLNDKIDKKLKELKVKTKKKIRKIVNKTENKVFRYVNNTIKKIKEEEKKEKEKDDEENDEQKNDEDKKEVEEEEEEEEEENKEEKEEQEKMEEVKKENNKLIKDDEKGKNKKKKKKKKICEFEIFDKSMNMIGKKLDKKICDKSSEIEGKVINYVKNSKAREYLQKKFTEEIDKKKFDNIFNTKEEKKKIAKEYLQSNNIKEKCQKVDKYVNKFVYSKHTERAINFFDKFDVVVANNVLNGTKDFSKLLDSKNKEEFRENAKILIEQKLYSLYENQIEPSLKELVINLCGALIDLIDKKINRKKNNEDKNN